MNDTLRDDQPNSNSTLVTCSSEAWDGYVYLAKADTGHYKIGRSVSPDKRIKHFDTQMPVDVREYHFFRADDYVEAERRLQNICGEHGEHVKGEWYDLPDYMIWWIKDIIFYNEGNFYGGDYHEHTPMDEPSDSYANYAKLFGRRTNRYRSLNTAVMPKGFTR